MSNMWKLLVEIWTWITIQQHDAIYAYMSIDAHSHTHAQNVISVYVFMILKLILSMVLNYYIKMMWKWYGIILVLFLIIYHRVS